jgi:hypothetical protein
MSKLNQFPKIHVDGPAGLKAVPFYVGVFDDLITVASLRVSHFRRN